MDFRIHYWDRETGHTCWMPNCSTDSTKMSKRVVFNKMTQKNCNSPIERGTWLLTNFVSSQKVSSSKRNLHYSTAYPKKLNLYILNRILRNTQQNKKCWKNTSASSCRTIRENQGKEKYKNLKYADNIRKEWVLHTPLDGSKLTF